MKTNHKCQHKAAVILSPRPKWPEGQNFALGLDALASTSASNIWPRPGLDLLVLLCNWVFFLQKSCKIWEFCMLFIIWYFFHTYFLASALASTSRNWPRPRTSGLSLEVLASFNITAKLTESAGFTVARSSTLPADVKNTKTESIVRM